MFAVFFFRGGIASFSQMSDDFWWSIYVLRMGLCKDD
jgi:hypothetical protein